MYIAKITGRKLQTAIEGPDGEPLDYVDTSPMVIRASDEAAAHAEARKLHIELEHSPEAQVELEDRTIPLHEWMDEAGAFDN